MVVSTYNNPASPSAYLLAPDFVNGYRQDFVAAHSNWRKPENIYLKMGVAGGSFKGQYVFQSGNYHPWTSNLSAPHGTLASYYNTLTRGNITTDGMVNGDVFFTYKINTKGVVGQLLSIRYHVVVSTVTSGQGLTWTVVLKNAETGATIASYNQTHLDTTGQLSYGASIINDGTWDAVIVEFQYNAHTFGNVNDSATFYYHTLHAFNSGVVNGYNFDGILPTVYPIIQDDSRVISAQAGTTGLNLNNYLNTGVQQHLWTYDPNEVDVMNGGDTYQLILPNFTNIAPATVWKGFPNGTGINLFPSFEYIRTGFTWDTIAVEDDVDAADYSDAYNNAIGDTHRANMKDNFDSSADGNYFDGGISRQVYYSYVDIVSHHNDYSLPPGTYGISFRVRVPGYAVGETAGAFQADYHGMGVFDRAGTLLWSGYYAPPEGTIYSYAVVTGTFTVPADGIVLFAFNIGVGNAETYSTAAKMPVFDNLVIWDNALTAPTVFNSGLDHAVAYVIEVDDSDVANNYEYSGEWILSGNQSPFALIQSSDATFPAPSTLVTDPFEGIDWNCDCGQQPAIVAQLFTAAQPIINAYSDLGVKILQIQSNSRPTDAFIIAKGTVEGIDVLNDANVVILWIDSEFNYVGKFVVYNGEFIQINELPGGFGYVEEYRMTLNANRDQAVLTIETWGDNFVPLIRLTGDNMVDLEINVTETDPDGIDTIIINWGAYSDYQLGDGVWSMLVDLVPEMNSIDMLAAPIVSRVKRTYTYTVDAFGVGVGDDQKIKSAILEIHYF